jgi:hypothetical protein
MQRGKQQLEELPDALDWTVDIKGPSPHSVLARSQILLVCAIGAWAALSKE